MIASRVTDATGGALVLFHPDGQVRLERLHCQSNQHCQDVKMAMGSGHSPGHRFLRYVGECGDRSPQRDGRPRSLCPPLPRG
jgi:hypothetical protein